MLKRLLVVAVGLFGLVNLTYAQVEISDSGEKEAKTNFFGNKLTKNRRSISIKNQGPVNYGFEYDYFLDPSIRGEKLTKPLPKGTFPCVANISTGAAGFSLMGSGAWFRSGFLGINVNRKLLSRTIAKIKVAEQGERGVVDFIWEPEWAEIKARFVFLPKDDKVYTEITINPKEEIKSLELVLFSVPGRMGGDRWLSTAKRTIQQSSEPASLNPKEEPWIYYFDTKGNIYGTCAVMYLPKEMTGAKVRLPRVSRTSLTVSPKVRKIHLILWDFPDSYKKPEDAYNYLKENEQELLEKLRKFKFE